MTKKEELEFKELDLNLLNPGDAITISGDEFATYGYIGKYTDRGYTINYVFHHREDDCLVELMASDLSLNYLQESVLHITHLGAIGHAHTIVQEQKREGK